MVAGAFGKSFSFRPTRQCAGPHGHRSRRDVGSSEGGVAAFDRGECGQDAPVVGTLITGPTAAMRPRLVKVEIPQPSAGTSLQPCLYTPPETRRYVQEGLWLSSPLAAGIGSAPLAVLRANHVIFFVSREQTLGQELGFDGALRGGSVRRKGQSACELIVPRRCPMRGSLDAVHLQEPARSVRHTKPYRALRKKKKRLRSAVSA